MSNDAGPSGCLEVLPGVLATLCILFAAMFLMSGWGAEIVMGACVLLVAPAVYAWATRKPVNTSDADSGKDPDSPSGSSRRIAELQHDLLVEEELKHATPEWRQRESKIQDELLDGAHVATTNIQNENCIQYAFVIFMAVAGVVAFVKYLLN